MEFADEVTLILKCGKNQKQQGSKNFAETLTLARVVFISDKIKIKKLKGINRYAGSCPKFVLNCSLAILKDAEAVHCTSIVSSV